eukprot:COSAG02_NODE_135_length_34565_cov_80.368856_9_plen_354_part_00
MKNQAAILCICITDPYIYSCTPGPKARAHPAFDLPFSTKNYASFSRCPPALGKHNADYRTVRIAHVWGCRLFTVFFFFSAGNLSPNFFGTDCPQVFNFPSCPNVRNTHGSVGNVGIMQNRAKTDRVSWIVSSGAKRFSFRFPLLGGFASRGTYPVAAQPHTAQCARSGCLLLRQTAEVGFSTKSIGNSLHVCVTLALAGRSDGAGPSPAAVVRNARSRREGRRYAVPSFLTNRGRALVSRDTPSHKRCQHSEPPPVGAGGLHSTGVCFEAVTALQMPAGGAQTPRVFSRACRSAGCEIGGGRAATFGVSLFDALGAARFASTPLAEVKTVRVRAESDEPRYSLGHTGDLCFAV